MAKILLTGGAGFIASHVADRYIHLNHEIVILDNLASGFRENIPKQVRFVEGDIRDTSVGQVFKEEKFDYVNHHAAQMDVRRSLREPLYDANVNILGTLNLLENARKYGVKKVIYISTGGAVHGEPASLPVKESDPICPECHYGISKHSSEHYLELYQFLYGLKYTILRYPNVYGPRQNPKGEAGVSAIFIGMMLQGQTPTIFGDGNQLRDYTYVMDVVDANVLALEKGDNEIYNVATGVGRSVNEIYSILQKIINHDRHANFGPRRLGEVEKIYLDPAKIEQAWGWKAKYKLEVGLQKTVDWFKAKGSKRFFK